MLYEDNRDLTDEVVGPMFEAQQQLYKESAEANVTVPCNIGFRVVIPGGGTLSEGRFAEIEPRLQVRDRGKGPYEVDLMFPKKMEGHVTVWGCDEGFAAVLTGLVRATRPAVCLETGTNKGRSARAIAEGLWYNERGHLTTVDLFDHRILESGAIPPQMHEYVTPLVAALPDALTKEPLASMEGIDFAYLDASHTRTAIEAEVAFVEAHRAEECLVLIDNSRDANWPEIQAFVESYTAYPILNLDTMCGTAVIQMRS